MEAKDLSSGANSSYNQFFDSLAALLVIKITVSHNEAVRAIVVDFGV